MVFVNEDTAAPLMEAAISADHLVDPDDPFSGTGTADFDVVVWLDPGDSLRFAVFGGPIGSIDGDFDVTALELSITSPAILHEVAKLLASDGAEQDRLGGSVAISGDTVVVGAHWNDDLGSNSGSAYVFIDNTLFVDEFETGDTSAWSLTTPLGVSTGATASWPILRNRF